jgi:hypothetical protein
MLAVVSCWWISLQQASCYPACYVWGMGYTSDMDFTVTWERLLQKPNTKSEHIFMLVLVRESSLVTWRIDGWEIVDTHTLTQSHIYLASTVMAPTWLRMKCCSAGGRWENYYVVGELAHHRFVFEYLYKNSKFLPIGWEFQMLGCWIRRSFLYIVH